MGFEITMTNPLNNKYIKEGYIILHSWFGQEWSPIKTGNKGRPEIYPENFIEFCSPSLPQLSNSVSCITTVTA